MADALRFYGILGKRSNRHPPTHLQVEVPFWTWQATTTAPSFFSFSNVLVFTYYPAQLPSRRVVVSVLVPLSFPSKDSHTTCFSYPF